MLESQPALDPVPPDPYQDCASEDLRLLTELIEMGMDTARAIRGQALAQADAVQALANGDLTNRPLPGGWITVEACGLAFSRITRAIRLTMAFRQRIIRDMAQDAKTACKAHKKLLQREAASADAAHQVRVDARRDEIIVDVAMAVIPSEEDIEVLGDTMRRVSEHLRDVEERELFDLPTGVLVARIVKDIGLPADWKQLQDRDWAIAEIANPPPGSPFEGWGEADDAADDPDTPPKVHDPP